MNRKKDSQINPPKTKTSKQKTVAVKSRIKGAPVKRPKSSTKDKPKGKPAPVVEAGYALYSSMSENSVSGDIDTCSELLARLKERRKESVQSDTNAPFNQRLSSSTPDPEKAIFHVEQGNIFQTVPERDSSGPVLKETLSNRLNFPVSSVSLQGVTLPSSSIDTRIPFNHYGIYTSSHGDIGTHGNADRFDTRDVINTSSSGFIPSVNTNTEADLQSWTRRDSDIQTYQAYIPRESTGFCVKVNDQKDNSKNDSKGHSSNSSGAKEISELIANNAGLISTNSSGTDYIVLPCPQGGVASGIPPGTPIFQLQNGLFQIRPANFQSQGQQKSVMGGSAQERHKTPSPVQNDLGGSYLGAEAFQIPERDNGPSAKRTEKITGIGIPQDTLSTISGTNSHHQTITPVSQRTVSVSMTPRTESSGNTENVPDFDIGSTSANQGHEVNRSKENAERVGNSSMAEKRDNSSQVSCQNSQKLHASGQSAQGKSFSSQNATDKNISNIDKQSGHNIQVITKSSTGTNNSGLASQGQIYILQPQSNLSAGSHSSSFQLVPVSVLPSSTLNSSLNMVTQQPKLTTSSGQTAKAAQEGHSEETGQKDSTEMPSAEKTHANIPNPWSKVKMDVGLKKLRYLLGELKECGKIGKDVEVTRLVKEVEKTIENIPTLSSKFNLMAEIDLCLQPLRNENCQLRRKLRLANQQLKEKETVKQKAALDFDVIHLQASNTALQKQVAGEKETKVKLAHELKELHTQIQRMKIERNKLLAALSEKETDELKIKQECLSDTQKFRHEIEQLQHQTEAIQVKHEATEQENHILQITLQDRDAEINKMQDVVNEVKDCVASLIQELEESKSGEKSFVSNNSFSLQKLARVLGEESVASFTQGKPIPRNTKDSHSSHREQQHFKELSASRLTQQALATHNRIQTKIPGTSIHGNKYPPSDIDFKTSNSDTEVELNVDNYRSRVRRSPARRGQSLSPPSKRTPVRETRIVNSSTKQSKHLSPTPTKNKDMNRSFSPVNRRNPKVAFDFSKNLYRKDSTEFYDEPDTVSNAQQSCNQSEASRYSVTDYFKKYPHNKPSDRESGRSRLHHRSYSQPNYSVEKPSTNMNLSERKDLTYRPSDLSPLQTNSTRGQNDKNAFSPQDHLYQGTCLDNSLSAITDDNISSVSERTSTSTATTINDTSFRRGIAALDANILKLQLALQKTKSMLS